MHKYVAPSSSRAPVVLAVTDTAARFVVPTSIAGRLCEFLSDGADCDVLFGGASVACVYGQASSVTTEVITTHASSGAHLVSKVAKLLRIPRTDVATHMSVDCVGSGSGKLYIQPIE